MVKVPESGDFKGYTMEELRYQRALLLIKREFVKEKALKEVKKIKEQIPLINGSEGHSSKGSGLLGKMMKSLSFIDYVLLGFQAIRIGRKFTSKFKTR